MAEDNGVPYYFEAGDVLRMKIFGKKNAQDVVLEKEITLPEHANGMRCCAYNREGQELSNEVYFSIGGGAIRRSDEMEELPEPPPVVPYPFDSCAELLPKFVSIR